MKFLFFILFVSIPTLEAQIYKDFGIRYDDYVNQRFTKYKQAFENAKNAHAIIEDGDSLILTSQSDDDEVQSNIRINFQEINEKEGALNISNSFGGEHTEETFLYIKRSKQEIDPEKLKRMILPKPDLGETITYNFNNSFILTWKNEKNIKFVTFSDEQKLLIRFSHYEDEETERYSLDAFIDYEVVRKWVGIPGHEFQLDYSVDITQEKDLDYPIRPTQIRFFDSLRTIHTDYYKEISFLEFSQTYNSLIKTFLNIYTDDYFPLGGGGSFL